MIAIGPQTTEQLWAYARAAPEAERQRILRLVEVAGIKPALNDHALELAATGDPERAIYDLFGLLELTRDQREIVRLYVEESRLIAVGANGLGKSLVLAALVLGWSWHVLGHQPGDDGEPQGCILLLVAPKEPQIIDAYRSHFLALGRRAAERGHPIAGWGDHSERSVSWAADPARWYMRALTAPREANPDAVSHFGLGPHHVNMVAWLEEVAGVNPAIVEALKGRLVSKGARAVASTNPTSATGTGHRLSVRDGWPTAYSSAFTHPNVLHRRTIYPGAVSHEALEADLRDPFLFERRPAGHPPDAARGDVVYCLPEMRATEMHGPRPDGLPGHPMAPPQVFRPLVPAVFGRWIGTWPTVDPAELFPPAVLELACRAWDAWGEPEGRPPRVVGLDGSQSATGDRAKATPWWGPSARVLWQVYHEATRQGANPLAAPGGVQIPAIAGRPLMLRNSLDEVGCVRELIDAYGMTPTYVVDPAWGGHLIAALKARGCTVKMAHFGARALKILPGQRRAALNARAEWCCTLSDVVRAGMVALPRDSDLLADLGALGAPVDVEKAQKGDKVAVVKIRDKDDIRSDLGRSPDAGDSVLLASSEGPYAGSGRVEAGRTSWI